MDHRVLQVGDAGALEALPQRRAGLRPVLADRAIYQVKGAVRRAGVHAGLGQAGGVGRQQRRRGQGLKQRVVLGAHEVQRAAVERGDHERTLFGELAIDVGGGDPASAGPDRQPRRPRILRLDGEQPFRDLQRVSGRPACDNLSREPLGEDGP
jgi:hypothetical protein